MVEPDASTPLINRGLQRVKVGHNDQRLNENVTYVAAFDEESFKEQRCIYTTGVCLLLTGIILLHPLVLGACFCVLPYMIWSYSGHKDNWELYITEKTLCHANPSTPKKVRVHTIPLCNIATVEARLENKMCGCCCRLPGQVVVVSLKASASRFSGVGAQDVLVIHLVEDAESFAKVLRQKIESSYV